MTIAQRPPRGTNASLWVTAPSAGIVVGVSVFCMLAVGNAPPPEVPEPEEEIVEPEPLPVWSAAIPPAAEERGCQISVQAESDGRPADDARFTLYRVGQHATESTWSAVPRADGAHRFADLPAGTYHLVAERDGRAPVAAETWTCEGAHERAFFALHLDDAGVLVRGKLTGRAGEPVIGSEIMLEQPDGFRSAFPGVLHIAVDEEGRFETRLAQGRYTQLALAPHHTPVTQELNIVSAQDIETRFRLAWRPEARGTVFDDAGEPVANARVYLGPNFDPKIPSASVVTESDGTFVLPVLPGRDITLTAKTGDGVGHIELGQVHKLEGHTGISIQLEAGRTVTGWLEHRNGRAVPFGKVTFRIKSLGVVGEVKANDDGTFLLAGVPHGADVELWPKDGAIGAWGGAVASPGRDRVLLTYVPPAY